MFANFDFDVISRSWGYLFREGMTFTITLTLIAMTGGIILGTLLAMMRLYGPPPIFTVESVEKLWSANSAKPAATSPKSPKSFAANLRSESRLAIVTDPSAGHSGS